MMYVSVVQWAHDSDDAARVESVVASCAFEAYDAEMRVRRGVPQVMCRTVPARGEVMLAEFARRGVLAFGATNEQIVAMGDAPRIKRPMLMHDRTGLVCEMWRGEGSAFAFSDVFCLVRATLVSSERTTTIKPDKRGRVVRGFMLGGMPGAALGAMSSMGRSSSSTSSRIRTTEMLDIYLRDGRRLRLDSDKLSFDILGEKKDYSDHANMKLLAGMLRRRASGAMYDEGFKGFVVPMEYVQERVRGVGRSTVRTHSDAGPFEFYSPWAYLMYRHLLRSGA